MVRSYWKKTLVTSVAWAGLAWGQQPLPSAAPANTANPPERPSRILTVQEPGRPNQKCKLITEWRTPQGTKAYQVQVLETGEMITILEAGPASAAPGAPAGSRVQAVTMRIFHWGSATTPPDGVPVPPGFSTQVASAPAPSAAAMPAPVKQAVHVEQTAKAPTPAAPAPTTPVASAAPAVAVGERVVTVHEAGKLPQQCRVLKTSRGKGGVTVYQVQPLQGGEAFTIEEGGSTRIVQGTAESPTTGGLVGRLLPRDRGTPAPSERIVDASNSNLAGTTSRLPTTPLGASGASSAPTDTVGLRASTWSGSRSTPASSGNYASGRTIDPGFAASSGTQVAQASHVSTGVAPTAGTSTAPVPFVVPSGTSTADGTASGPAPAADQWLVPGSSGRSGTSKATTVVSSPSEASPVVVGTSSERGLPLVQKIHDYFHPPVIVKEGPALRPTPTPAGDTAAPATASDLKTGLMPATVGAIKTGSAPAIAGDVKPAAAEVVSAPPTDWRQSWGKADDHHSPKPGDEKPLPQAAKDRPDPLTDLQRLNHRAKEGKQLAAQQEAIRVIPVPAESNRITAASAEAPGAVHFVPTTERAPMVTAMPAQVPLGSRSVLAAAEASETIVPAVPAPAATPTDVRRMPPGPTSPASQVAATQAAAAGDNPSVNAFTTPPTGPGSSAVAFNAFSSVPPTGVPAGANNAFVLPADPAVPSGYAWQRPAPAVVPAAYAYAGQAAPGGVTPGVTQVRYNPAMDRRAPAPATPVPPAAAPENKQEMLKTLRDSLYPSQREAAAESLAAAGGPAHADVAQALLTAAREDPAATVRASCVRCLVRLRVGGAPVVGTLQALRNDADVRVREEAERALYVLTAGQPAAATSVQPVSAPGR